MRTGCGRLAGKWGCIIAAVGLLAGCSAPVSPVRPARMPPMPPATAPAAGAAQPVAPAPIPDDEAPPSPSPLCPDPADPIGDLIGSEEKPPGTPGERALETARSLLGARYIFGGDSPDGFDCSGLVRYVFRQSGVDLPRTSSAMFKQTRKIGLDRLQPGDLLFFQISKQRISHVGIYAEEDRFIHSPSRGKEVTYSSLNDPYWRRRLVGAGRVVSPADARPAASIPTAGPEG